jgi:chemotaxis methyl-accepting protein methylase
MHKLMADGAILEHELSELRLLVERQTGVLLDLPNSALAAHVSEYLEVQEIESAAILLDRLRCSDQEPNALPSFLEGLISAKTGFFRHPGAMNALARQVLPQLLARKSAEGPATLRIWSAGCATGEEAYSIAMAVCEWVQNGKPAPVASSTGSENGNNGALNKEKSKGKNSASRSGGIADGSLIPPQSLCAPLPDWSVHIVGSDLLPSAIQAAERGLYPQSAVAGLPPATIRASFSKIGPPNTGQNGSSNGSAAAPKNGGPLGQKEPRSNEFPGNVSNGDEPSPVAESHLLVKPRLRSLVTFNTMNLVRPVYIGRFDCIFCMDVLTQFSRAQRTALLERLHLYLEPGGYLFLSQTEKLCAANLNFRSETFDGYTMHRKPLAASAAYGR